MISKPIETSEELGRLLADSAKREMTVAEEFEQRVSYVYGLLPDGNPLTKEDIRRDLAKRYRTS